MFLCLFLAVWVTTLFGIQGGNTKQ